ncbi:MAG: DNA alkylation repair protein [Deltaproteobacteria bacterium]|nr:DNA alkylation repair protein [Deltaproteobacteria bacterium]
MSAIVKKIKTELKQTGDDKIARHSLRFFKTKKGEYGEGDRFLGIRVPVLRKIAEKYQNISINDISELINSKYHEQRFFAVVIIINAFKKGNENIKKRIYEFYLNNTKFINNWDIVDVSASNIAGAYLEDKDKKPLYDLALSKNLWKRRIAIVSTHHFIKKNNFKDAFNISDMLLTDKEDLIHKAIGWTIREVGKRSLETEEKFLKNRYKNMPRTMLRYAIEKFEENKRKKYLKGEI